MKLSLFTLRCLVPDSHLWYSLNPIDKAFNQDFILSYAKLLFIFVSYHPSLSIVCLAIVDIIHQKELFVQLFWISPIKKYFLFSFFSISPIKKVFFVRLFWISPIKELFVQLFWISFFFAILVLVLVGVTHCIYAFVSVWVNYRKKVAMESTYLKQWKL